MQLAIARTMRIEIFAKEWVFCLRDSSSSALQVLILCARDIDRVICLECHGKSLRFPMKTETRLSC